MLIKVNLLLMSKLKVKVATYIYIIHYIYNRVYSLKYTRRKVIKLIYVNYFHVNYFWRLFYPANPTALPRVRVKTYPTHNVPKSSRTHAKSTRTHPKSSRTHPKSSRTQAKTTQVKTYPHPSQVVPIPSQNVPRAKSSRTHSQVKTYPQPSQVVPTPSQNVHIISYSVSKKTIHTK